MLSVSTTKLFPSGEVSRGPLSAAVPDEKEGFFPVDVTLHCTTDDWSRAGQVLEYLDYITIYIIRICFRKKNVELIYATFIK